MLKKGLLSGYENFNILKPNTWSSLKVAAMVLILGRRMNREDSGIRESPAVKRKVLSLKKFWKKKNLFCFIE